MGSTAKPALHLDGGGDEPGPTGRNALLVNPASVAMPLEKLLQLRLRLPQRARIQLNANTPSLLLSPQGIRLQEGPTPPDTLGDRRDGSLVATTTTLNFAFGWVSVPGGRFPCLTTRMDDFTAKPGVPSLRPWVQGEANAIAPGNSRSLDGAHAGARPTRRPLLASGSPGGQPLNHTSGAAGAALIGPIGTGSTTWPQAGLTQPEMPPTVRALARTLRIAAHGEDTWRAPGAQPP